MTLTKYETLVSTEIVKLKLTDEMQALIRLASEGKKGRYVIAKMIGTQLGMVTKEDYEPLNTYVDKMVVEYLVKGVANEPQSTTKSKWQD